MNVIPGNRESPGGEVAPVPQARQPVMNIPRERNFCYSLYPVWQLVQINYEKKDNKKERKRDLFSFFIFSLLNCDCFSFPFSPNQPLLKNSRCWHNLIKFFFLLVLVNERAVFEVYNIEAPKYNLIKIIDQENDFSRFCKLRGTACYKNDICSDEDAVHLVSINIFLFHDVWTHAHLNFDHDLFIA